MTKKPSAIAAAMLLAAGCGSQHAGSGSPDLAVPYGPVQVPPGIELFAGPGTAMTSPAAPSFGYRLQQAFTLSEHNGVGATINRFRLTVLRFGATEVRDLEGAALMAQVGSSRIDPLATRQITIAIDFNTLPAEQMTGEFDYAGDDGLTRPVSVPLVPQIDLGQQGVALTSTQPKPDLR